MNRLPDRGSFITANTAIMTPPLVPEIKLHLAHEAVPIWQKTEDELGEMGLPPPFWAFAWAGGQALARYVLDRPEVVREKRVIDLASGSGLVAIAAKLAGAASVVAADVDPFSIAAIKQNAALNSISLEMTAVDLLELQALKCDPPTRHGRACPGHLLPCCSEEDARNKCGHDERRELKCAPDALASQPPAAQVVLVGDFFYERELAAKAFAWLKDAKGKGASVLIGDPGRSYLPQESLEKLAEYSVPVTRELEDAGIKRGAVWTIRNC